MTDDAHEGARELPVVLIHGFLSTSEMLLPLASKLGKKGYKVFRAELGPFVLQDVRRLALEVEESVEKALGATGASQCHLVGLSQGGIIGLFFTKLIDTSRRVRRFVAVATPFQGTWAPVAGLVTMPWLGLFSAGLWQVMPNSLLLAELHNAPLPPGVEISTIAIDGDLIAPPERCQLPGVPHVVVPGVPLMGHQLAVISPAVSEKVIEALRGRKTGKN